MHLIPIVISELTASGGACECGALSAARKQQQIDVPEFVKWYNTQSSLLCKNAETERDGRNISLSRKCSGRLVFLCCCLPVSVAGSFIRSF